METLSTKDKLLQAGREEFLAKGYKDASLREIGKKAGFTLGAFYGYYASKEALFEDIVSSAAGALYERFAQVQGVFADLPENEQAAQLDDFSQAGLLEMVDLIYQNFDIFKLVFFRSAGTPYEDYMQRFVEIEIEATHRFIKTLQKQGHALQVDDEIIHILASAMFSGMMEVVDHDMPKEKAVRYISQLRAFYSAGWHHLLRL